MITAKFGGSSVTAQNFGNLKRLVTKNHGCVVVSAVGKEHARDQKVTDLLFRHFHGDSSAWRRLSEKYRRVVAVNGVEIDIDKLLFEAEKTSRMFGLDYCLSLGEELSAKITAAFLSCPYVEAAKCIVFDDKKLLWRQTKANLKSAFGGLNLGVFGGFYGGIRGTNARRVFPRGGGDVSGAICAAALSSSLYENYTDVNGVCDADPRRIFGAKTTPQLSYFQMYMLARCGAEVLHADAVRISQKYGVPICVRNSLNDSAPSTLISNCPSLSPFLAVTERSDGMFSTVALHSMPLSAVFVRLASVDDISRCVVTKNHVEITSRRSILREVYRAFSD